MSIFTAWMLIQVQRWVTLSVAVLRRHSRSIASGSSVSTAMLTAIVPGTAQNLARTSSLVETASM